MTDVHRLPAVLGACHRRNDLGHDGTRNLKGLGAFNHLAVHHGAVVQHIPDVDQTAVEDRLEKIVGVVEVKNALVVRLGDLLRQKDTPGKVFRHLSGDQVTLGGRHHGVFVGVFLHHVLVGVLDQRQN